MRVYAVARRERGRELDRDRETERYRKVDRRAWNVCMCMGMYTCTDAETS